MRGPDQVERTLRLIFGKDIAGAITPYKRYNDKIAREEEAEYRGDVLINKYRKNVLRLKLTNFVYIMLQSLCDWQCRPSVIRNKARQLKGDVVWDASLRRYEEEFFEKHDTKLVNIAQLTARYYAHLDTEWKERMEETAKNNIYCNGQWLTIGANTQAN